MDDVVVVDHMTMATIPKGTTARQRHKTRAPQKQRPPIIVAPDTELVTNQPGRPVYESLRKVSPRRLQTKSGLNMNLWRH